VGDDVAPTSLNEGRGKGPVIVFVVALRVKPLVDGWGGAMVVQWYERAAQMRNRRNAKCGIDYCAKCGM